MSSLISLQGLPCLVRHGLHGQGQLAERRRWVRPPAFDPQRSPADALRDGSGVDVGLQHPRLDPPACCGLIVHRTLQGGEVDPKSTEASAPRSSTAHAEKSLMSGVRCTFRLKLALTNR